MIREKPFSFGDLWWVIRNCHFYDLDSGYYKDSAERRAVVPGTTSSVPNT
jgi:omega-6 fatty acid desaturase (delta-12 desaturase)